MTNVPNYKQVEQISHDLSLLTSGHGNEIQDWRDNKCYGHAWQNVSYGNWFYDLHWDGALIATYVSTPSSIECYYFDTTYYSAACKRFQDRILAAAGAVLKGQE